MCQNCSSNRSKVESTDLHRTGFKVSFHFDRLSFLHAQLVKIFSEWYSPGDAPDSYPTASSASLHSSRVRRDWQPLHNHPAYSGETIEELHARVKHVFSKLEDRAREHGYRSILVVSHAATIIALGRAVMDDTSFNLRTGCCALSQFARSPTSKHWECTKNGDASHLERGEERHWESGHLGIGLQSDTVQRTAKL